VNTNEVLEEYLFLTKYKKTYLLKKKWLKYSF